MRPHEEIRAWQLCHSLALAVYAATRAWPRQETYGLTSQVRRASVSAAVNIVEGSAKRGMREFRRFLDISNGSLAEVGYLLVLSRELGYLSPTDWGKLDARWDEAARTTMALYRSIGRRLTRTP